jgi:hypothetical protein
MANLNYTITSKKYNKKVTFSRPGTDYIFCDLNGQPGTLGVQLFKKGSAVGFAGSENLDDFKAVCKEWLKDHIKNNLL